MIYEDITKCTANYVCPNCGQKGNFVNHGGYFRFLVQQPKIFSIKIQRLKCCSCNKTHAIIPENVIPYKSISLDMAINMTIDWSKGYSNSQICSKYNISESTRQRYFETIKRFLPRLYGVCTVERSIKKLIPDNFKETVNQLCITKLGRKFCEHIRLINLQQQVKQYSSGST